MAKPDLMDKVMLPEGVEVIIEPTKIIIKGPKGELARKLNSPVVNVTKEENAVVFKVEKASKKEKMMMKTTKANVRNMVNGVTEGYEYNLKICSGHFPMSVKFENGEIIVNNFLGESIPRKTKISDDVKVEVKGNDITVTGIDKERTGQAAARIESTTRMTNKDRRRYQDGIFIINKAGKKI